MRIGWSSLSLGWFLYAGGLLTVFIFGEMTRSFEALLAVYVLIGLVLLSHRVAAGSRIDRASRGGVPSIDVALFAFLWPVVGCVALLFLSVTGAEPRSVALDQAA